MVIDDEPTLVDLARQFLNRAGFPSVGFTSGEEAIRWYRQHHRQVGMTVLDMKMPGISGEHCFQALRSIDPEARVVVLSGDVQPGATERMLEGGALWVFQKPLEYARLMQWIAANFH